ncbi:MAG: PQQ-dependent sugar dehydrogenase, partial [Propionibacteriaceae bacterium]|nr:PQQ-dependent sugar dehydrogenase [Propionibacteriaceae bacterium]
MGRVLTLTLALVALAGCAAPVAPRPASPPVPATAGRPFVVEQLDRFDEPWAMTFLPDGGLL